MRFCVTHKFNTILAILLLLCLGGCSKKYVPSEAVNIKSNYMTTMQATSTLKNNLYISKAPKNSGFWLGYHNLGFFDNETSLSISDRHIQYINGFKTGKKLGLVSSKNYGTVHFTTTRYEKERHTYDAISLNKIYKIHRHRTSDSNDFCQDDSMLVFWIPGQKVFSLCSKDDEEVFAAILKLMPKVEIGLLGEEQ